MSQASRSGGFRPRCTCNDNVSFSATASTWRKRLRRFCSCKECTNIYDKCVGGNADWNDVCDYFNKHAITVDDNVLNVIYNNFMISKHPLLLEHILKIEDMKCNYDFLLGDEVDYHLGLFCRMSTSLLTYDLLVKSCGLEEVIYGSGNDDTDLRLLWNDGIIAYYKSHDARVDVNAAVKILVARSGNDDDFSSINVNDYIASIMDEMTKNGVLFCEHVDTNVLKSILIAIRSIPKDGNPHMEDVSTQVSQSILDSTASRQRIFRPRRSHE